MTLTMPPAAKAPVPLVVMAPECLGWRPSKLDRWRLIFLAVGHAVLLIYASIRVLVFSWFWP